jgi:hypothetical protein
MAAAIVIAFPIYIVFLVVLLILISRYSSRFSKLIADREESSSNFSDPGILAQPFSYAMQAYTDGRNKGLVAS